MMILLRDIDSSTCGSLTENRDYIFGICNDLWRVKRKNVYICWMCNGPPEFVCCLLPSEWLNCLLNCRPKLHSFILKKKCYSQTLWRHFSVVFHTGWKSRTSTRFLEITTLISITQVIFVLGKMLHSEEEVSKLNTSHIKSYLSRLPSDALCIRNKVWKPN